MANVRIAQFGQTAVNRPLWEVFADGKRYAFGIDATGRVGFRSPAFLKSIGVYSSVANQYEDSPVGVRAVLNLDNAFTTIRDNRFAALSLGSGLAVVDDWSNNVGWKSYFPVFYKSFNV